MRRENTERRLRNSPYHISGVFVNAEMNSCSLVRRMSWRAATGCGPSACAKFSIAPHAALPQGHLKTYGVPPWM